MVMELSPYYGYWVGSLELVDIKGPLGISRGLWGLVDIKGGKRNS